MNPLLSVIVPVYNTSFYLKRCIESICKQSFVQLEIICVDDGSTDDSLEILEQISKNEPRIRIIRRAHNGLVEARKAGLSEAKGDYVTYVDSDDWIESSMYEEMVRSAKESGADIITSGIIRDYGSFTRDDPEKAEPGLYDGERLKILKSQLIDTKEAFRFNVMPSLCIKLFRRELLLKHQMSVPGTIRIEEATVCSFPCLWDSKSVYVTGKCYYHYCSRNDSMMHQIDDVADERKRIDEAYRYFRGRVCEIGFPAEIIDEQMRYLEMYCRLDALPEDIIRFENGDIYPFGKVESGSRIIVYGAGTFGNRATKCLKECKDIRVVAQADKNGDGNTIRRPEQLPDMEFDYIFICVLLAGVSEEIKRQLMEMGIPEPKIKRIQVA